MTGWTIRPETPPDGAAISALITQGFADAPHADGTEAQVVDRLRAVGGLSLSLVAVQGDRIVGHVGASPATVGGQGGWACIGPLVVQADLRRRGIGAALMRQGLARLAATGSRGAVLLGDPAYYGRFGLAPRPGLTAAPFPDPVVQALAFGPAPVWGPIGFHPAFGLG